MTRTSKLGKIGSVLHKYHILTTKHWPLQATPGFNPLTPSFPLRFLDQDEINEVVRKAKAKAKKTQEDECKDDSQEKASSFTPMDTDDETSRGGRSQGEGRRTST